MNRRIRLHPAALQELEEAAAFYDLEGPGLGGAFLDDFERAGEQILLLPESSPIARKYARRKLMARFPYAVVYSLRSPLIRNALGTSQCPQDGSMDNCDLGYYNPELDTQVSN